MNTPDARLRLTAQCVIASLAAILVTRPISAIATPAPTELAYYKININTFELYVKPFWFGRSELERRQVDTAIADESSEGKELEMDQLLPSLQVPTESESNPNAQT